MLNKKRILEVLPEIRKIRNKEWQKAAIAVWQKAFERSCWKDIMDAPNMTIFGDDPLIRHTRAVTAIAGHIADIEEASQGIKVDRDKLLLITLLHDVDKLTENEPVPGSCTDFQKTESGRYIPHGFLGAFYCREAGLPDDVVEAISSHSFMVKYPAPSIEGVIFNLADLADADIVMYRHGAKLFQERLKNY